MYISSSSDSLIDLSARPNLSNLININPLINSLIRLYGWNVRRAEQACHKYLNFLYLRWLYPHYLLIPTQEIDHVWHCHILHTRQYRQDCQALFGHYLDHDPDLNWELLPNQSPQSVFNQTKSLFERHFGRGSFSEFIDESSSNSSAICALLERYLEMSHTDVYGDGPSACGCPHIQP